jgi:hypothetical protein
MKTDFHPISWYDPARTETNKNVWSYWDGDIKTKPFIDLCLQTLSLHNKTHQVVRPGDLPSMPGGADILDYITRNTFCHAHQSDLVRHFLLDLYGGVWVDSDCIGFAPLDTFEFLETHAMTVPVNGWKGWNSDNGCLASPLGVHAGSLESKYMLAECKRLLDLKAAGKNDVWASTANVMYGRMVGSGSFNIATPQRWRYQRLLTLGQGQLLTRHPSPQNMRAALGHVPKIMHFGGNKKWAPESYRELLGGHTVLGSCLRQALGMPAPSLAHSFACRLRTEMVEPPYRAAEIGVCKGENLEGMAFDPARVAELVLVDRWGDPSQTYVASKDKLAKRVASEGESWMQEARQRALPLGDKATFLRMDSGEAAKQFSDGHFDIVFLDADHSYEGCASDIQAWAPKVKSGGWLGGHDFIGRPTWGVQKAVTEWVAADPHRDLQTDIGNTWWVQIP